MFDFHKLMRWVNKYFCTHFRDGKKGGLESLSCMQTPSCLIRKWDSDSVLSEVKGFIYIYIYIFEISVSGGFINVHEANPWILETCSFQFSGT